MKKIIGLFLALLISFGAAFAGSAVNPYNIKNDNEYTKYAEDILFEKTPTAFSYVKRQIKYKAVIEKDGTISNYEMLDSSGSTKYDDKVKEAISNLKLQPFPKNTKMKNLTFTYDVEKRTSIKVPLNVLPVNIKLPK